LRRLLEILISSVSPAVAVASAADSPVLAALRKSIAETIPK